MITMAFLSKQRAHYSEAVQLSHEASSSLQPLNDDLASLSPSFDGIVYFARDDWHKNNASAVASVQPESSNSERFAFYKNNIEGRRVDLGSTALGYGLSLSEPRFLKSRMNPNGHSTWAHRAIIDQTVVGGLQAAFAPQYGPIPESTKVIDRIWKRHEAAVLDVAAGFRDIASKVSSVGDTLELLPPTTPNAIIASWDTRGSTSLAAEKYGTLRNYLLDTKRLFSEQTVPYATYIDDTGDGQDITFYLPESSKKFNRASPDEVNAFAKVHILPLIQRLIATHNDLAAESYNDIAPRINFAIGAGYVEQTGYDGRTSQGYWENAKVLKTHPEAPVCFTKDLN